MHVNVRQAHFVSIPLFIGTPSHHVLLSIFMMLKKRNFKKLGIKLRLPNNNLKPCVYAGSKQLDEKATRIPWFSLFSGQSIHLSAVVAIVGNFFFLKNERQNVTTCGKKDSWVKRFQGYCKKRGRWYQKEKTVNWGSLK